ncbi:MAG: flagellar hook-associated protein FlgK [Synergistales bacterium]
MSSTFSGLEIGRAALNYFRQGILTAGHNMSNADVEGFSRQRVEASAGNAYSPLGLNGAAGPGQVGTGVKIDAVIRIRDAFLDGQVRQESTRAGYWETLEATLSNLELFLGEPSETGLSASIAQIGSALQEFQKRPDSSSARESFVQELDNFCSLLGRISGNADDLRVSLDRQIQAKTLEANGLIDNIAALNRQIMSQKALGNNPNDLMDRRDLMVERLSALAGIEAFESPPDGSLSVSLRGHLLVQGTEARHLVLVPQAGNGGFYDVQVEDNLFAFTGTPSVALAEVAPASPEGVHNLRVDRLATETRWALGDDTGNLAYPSADAALGIEGAFSLSVGVNGFSAVSDRIGGGVLLDGISENERTRYVFRVASGTGEQVVEVLWKDAADPSSSGHWEANGADLGSTVTFTGLAAVLNDPAGAYPVTAATDSAGERLTLAGNGDFLVSVVDLEGNLMAMAGLDPSDAAASIEVDENDSLLTIANRINGSGLALHATVENASDGSFFLRIESNEAGEANRINVGTAEGTSLSVARMLGLVNGSGQSRILRHAEDALFSLDGRRYLSSTNTFSEARLVGPEDGFRASAPQTVLEGLKLHLTGTGESDIVMRHPVSGGVLEGLLESRDGVVPAMTAFLDNFAWVLSGQFNAVHQSGYGFAEYGRTTGTSLFTPLAGKENAASALAVNPAVLKNPNLLAAASGDGSGKSLGSGDGSNALNLIALLSKGIYPDGSTIEGTLLSFVASLGSKSRQASIMNENQQTLLEQIDNQRASVMGVNIDEESTDLIRFQQSYSAVARYITALDEMLDTVINGMGIVGR